jgi:heme o synthase
VTVLARANDYYELSKPRIIALLLITTVASMVMAARGLPPLALLFWTLVAGALAAASAGAFNCIWDRDIDRVMKRTAARPIPQGRISPRNATIYALLTGAISFALFYTFVNPLAAWLSLAGNIYYVVVYTMWLKRITPLNIVIGGAAGAVPVLIGWSAVTNSLALTPFLLFLVIFIWTPPHFWALAVRYRDDYAAANVPMLPVVASLRRTTLEIFVYTVVLWAVTMLVGPVAHLGWVYAISALVLGGLFCLYAAQLHRLSRQDRADVARAMRLFHFSITYLSALFILMAVDVLVRHH